MVSLMKYVPPVAPAVICIYELLRDYVRSAETLQKAVFHDQLDKFLYHENTHISFLILLQSVPESIISSPLPLCDQK